MATSVSALAERIRRMDPASDRELLAAFVERQSEEAFRALVDRHGPMVWRVCRNVLGHDADAEDALQATFVVLARRARALERRRPESLAAWLHGVARRVALKARTARARQLRRDSRAVMMPPSEPVAELTARELMAALDEEVGRAPMVYRLPLLLCFWQGLTQDEAASRLGWTPGSLKGRLERGRKWLRSRLERRGIAPAILLAAPAAALPDALSAKAAAAALPTTALPAAVTQLVAGEMASRLPRLAAFGLALAVATAIGAGLLGGGAAPVTPGEEPKKAEAVPIVGPQRPAPNHVDVSGDPLPDGAVARLGTTRLRPGKMIHAMEFSPDGKQLAVWARDWSGGTSDRLIFYDPSTGRESRSIALPPNVFFAMRWLADGRGLAVVKLDRRELYVWEFTNPSVPLPRKDKADASTQFPGDILAAAISPDGRWLVTGRSSIDGKDQPLELWELKPNTPLADVKPRPLGTMFGHEMHFVFRADGKLVFVLSRKHEAANAAGGAVMPGKPVERSRLDIYEVESGKVVNSFDVAPPFRYMEGSEPPPEQMGLSPDGKTIWIGDEKGTLHAYDWTTGKETASFVAHPEGDSNTFERAGVSALKFSADAGTLFTSGRYGGFAMRDAKTGKPRKTIPLEPSGVGRFFALSPDGTRLAVADQHSAANVHLFDAKSGEQLLPLPGHTGSIRELAVIRDGTVVTGGTDNRLRWWDLEKGRELKIQHIELPRFLRTWSTLTSDGRGAFVILDKRLIFVELATQKQTTITESMEKPFERLHGVSGSSVFFTTPDGKIQQWDANIGAVCRSFDPPPGLGGSGWPGRVLFSPDGRYVAIFAAGWVRSGNVGYFNGSSLSFFDAKTGELRRRWQTNECRFQCAEFSTDGNYFVVGGASSGASRAPIPEEMKLPIQARLGLLLFDAHTGEAIRAFEPPVRNQHDFYGVQTVAISANRHLVAAVQTDSSIAVYELATGALCRVFRGHENQVPQLAFTADGRRLVSASWDTTALVWDTSYTKLAKPAIDSSDKLWADLAKPEWQLAGPALAALAVKPDEFLSLIKERFPVATNADFDRDAIAKWVEQLDDQVFAVRERAAAALARLGREALPVLRDHLAKATVPERKSRLRKTIDQVAGSPIPSGHLRERRVLALLEQIDSSASRRELERLAGGHAEASLTQEAKSALERRVK